MGFSWRKGGFLETFTIEKPRRYCSWGPAGNKDIVCSQREAARTELRNSVKQ